MKFLANMIAAVMVATVSLAQAAPATPKGSLPKFYCSAYTLETASNPEWQEEYTFFSEKNVSRAVIPSKRVKGWYADQYTCKSTAKV